MHTHFPLCCASPSDGEAAGEGWTRKFRAHLVKMHDLVSDEREEGRDNHSDPGGAHGRELQRKIEEGEG